uniref:Cytoplasmic polyadenylation element-binding protein 4-like n=1 Tax=Cyprinodon variegatus TaxID=28743 RepID=A0A3Q2EHJ2_CYPVA
MEDERSFGEDESGDQGLAGLGSAHCFPHLNGERVERYSRKVFVGGLPPDIDEDEITASFRRFGHLFVDWPHKAESKSYFPPKGYAFLLFQDESSVQALIDACIQEDGKLYLCVSSPTIKDKPVSVLLPSAPIGGINTLKQDLKQIIWLHLTFKKSPLIIVSMC